MPLPKQSLDINFAQGLDTKTDPWQTDPNTFLALSNSVFTTGKRLTKRNGYQKLSSLPGAASHLTTFNDNPTAIGNSIYAYNPTDDSWVSRGTIQPLEVDALPLIRNNINQTQCDSAVSSNGLVCTVYTETNGSTTNYRYAIASVTTGQIIVAPSAIPVASGTVSGALRVFVLGNYFIIGFTNLITATNHLQYIAIPITNPTAYTVNADIAASYVPAAHISWDATVVNDNLYIAYVATNNSIKVTYLTGYLSLTTAVTVSGAGVVPLISVCADTTIDNPAVYVTFFNSSANLVRTFAVDTTLAPLLSATTVYSTSAAINLASAALGGACRVFIEITNAYSYDSSIPSNYIEAVTVNTAATVGTPYVAIRSVGLGSKAFIVDSVIYFLAAFQSPYQPTYFLINGSSTTAASPVIAGKLAYGNGGGYLTLGLPNVSVNDTNVAQVPYLFKDLIAAVNKNTNVASGTQTAGIYSQTGINLGSFTIGTENIDTSEIGSDLHISGGFLWMYDGYLPVEHNFFLWPDSVKATIQADPTPTGDVSDSVTPTVMTSVSSVTGITVGMGISGTGIPANTTVVAVGTTTITMSAAATSAHTGSTYTFTGALTSEVEYYQVTYEWTDNQGNAFRSAPSVPVTVTASAGHSSTTINIPTLRLTYKTANPVKIVIYRWSTSQQIYYQVTSISQPQLNSTTTDSIQYIDISSNASILGNNILYTTGGVVENVNAPASNLITLFDNRLWLVDAEDKNLLWFSKEVIESVPVEMSDLLTYFVAPSQGAQGSTGPVSAIAPLDDKLIIFKSDGIYYLNGSGPDNAGSNSQYSQPIFITSTVGCSNQASIVFMPSGLMFQSNKGIWLLGRDLQTSYIGAAVEQFNGSVVQSAVNVPETNQVRFTLDTGQTLMYDYFYGQWGTFTGVPAISACISSELHTFLNQYGDVYQENPGSYLDGSNPVLISFTTSWFNLAGLQGYQRAFWFYLVGKYLSPHKLQVTIGYDFNASPSQSSLISPTNYSQPFGGANPNPNDGTDSADPFGQGSPFGGPSDLEQWRVFLTKQRCQSIQLSVQEVYDMSFGVPAGQGLTLSGIKLTFAAKQSFRPMSASQSIGGGTA